jgi:hypothetical protein
VTRRPTWLAVLAAALAFVTAVSAQRPTPPRDAIGPDDVRRVGDWLKGMQGGPGFDPALLKQALEFLQKNPQLAKQLQEFQKQNPNPDTKQLQQFAEQLKQNPALKDQKVQADLKQFAEKLGGMTANPKLPNVETPPLSGLGGLVTGKKSGTGTETPLDPQTKPPVPNTPFANTQPPGKTPTGSGQPSDVTPPLEGNPPGKVPTDFGPFSQQLQNGFTNTPHLNPKGFGPTGGGAPTLPNATGPQQQKYAKMAGWWEKNVGPLQDSPAITQLMVDFATGSGNSSGQSSFGDLFTDEKGGETSLGKLADVNTGTSNWKFPDLGIGKPDFNLGGAPDLSGPMPSAGSAPSVGDLGSAGGTSWLPVVMLAVIAGVGLLLWWLWPKLLAGRAGGPRPLTGLGPWPVDPRTIADRAALVKAFEYLSVLRCGTGAKVWNHVTIADELRRAVPEVGDLAGPLARLYAVARYTPAAEPLADADLVEARGHLCRLAGVSP